MRAGTRSFQGDSGGASPLIGLLVGFAVFSVGFYVVVDTALLREGDVTRAEGASMAAQAAALSHVIAGSGFGWYDGVPCRQVGQTASYNKEEFNPDKLGSGQGRFGLGDDGCLLPASDPRARNNLSYDKLASLFGGKDEADPDNEKVDYPEARKSLGLEEDALDFHLRSWPILASTRQILEGGQLDPFMRPLYIGDYEKVTETVRKVQHKAGVVDGADEITVYVEITNNGTTATIFGTLFSIPLDRRSVDFTLHTPLLASGESYNVTVKIRKTSDWSWDDPNDQKVHYTIQDPKAAIQSGSINLAGITMSYALSRLNVFPEADKMFWVATGGTPVTAKINYGAYKGNGDDTPFADWTLSTLDPLGLPMLPVVLPNVDEGTATQTLVLVGAHKGRIQNDLLSLTWNLDVLNVVASEPGEFTTGGASTYQPSEAAIAEARFLDLLVGQFDPYVHSAAYDHVLLPYAATGDVFPDIKDVLNEDVPAALRDPGGAPTLARYNLLVVGSNVDHNAMTSAAAKNTIRDWVLAGGTLLAFGSPEQNVNWLQPLFHASLDTASGGIYTPDSDHPALNQPNALDYAAFQYSTSWGYTAGAEDHFTHIVQAGDGDVLAYGNPGSFGNGRIALSSWRPYDLVSNQAAACDSPSSTGPECQALNLIHNLLSLGYRNLYLDYGPPVPVGAHTGSHIRILATYHPELEELIPMQLQVLVFEGG